MRTKKRGQVTSTLVLIIAGLVGLLVILMVTGQLAKIYKSVTGKSECQIEFFISSFTKGGGIQTTEPSCEPHKITITMENLTKDQPRAKKILMDYNSNYNAKYKGIESADKYFTQFQSGANDQNLNEWLIDETIAKEMKYCWDVTGRGKLDLFNDWWSLLECSDTGKEPYHPCTQSEIYKMYGADSTGSLLKTGAVTYSIGAISGVGGLPVLVVAGGAPVLYGYISGEKKAATPPTFCVLCSRIKFEDKVNQSFSEKQIDSMGLWLANNPVSDVGLQQKIPYAAYLQNDAYKGILAENAYTYSVAEPYAVVYARINVFKANSMLNTVGNWIFSSNQETPEAIQTIKLVPYKNLQNECTYLVG